ncbi:hypothetical protein BaRGS_00014607, partial [Batillaria attramentaria]
RCLPTQQRVSVTIPVKGLIWSCRNLFPVCLNGRSCSHHVTMNDAHKKHLTSIHGKLVRGISDVEGVVDGLIERGVLTQTLADRIGSPITTKRVRELLLMLPKRDIDAFDAFYAALVECDEGAAADLVRPDLAAQRRERKAASVLLNPGGPYSGVPYPQPVQDPIPVPPEEDELPDRWPDTNHDPMRVEVVRVKSLDMEARFHRAARGIGGMYYPMHHAKRGKFLLLNNENFENSDPKLTDREGTIMDQMALDMLFEQLDFHVVVKKNNTAEVKSVRSTACSRAAVDEGAGKSESDNVEEVTRALEEMNITPQDVEKKDATGEGPPPTKADIFVAMATVEDYVSFRNTEWGSWFTQAVVYVFSRFAHKYDLHQLMTRVNALVGKAKTSSKKLKQMSATKHSLRKDFYFFPGLSSEEGKQ